MRFGEREAYASVPADDQAVAAQRTVRQGFELVDLQPERAGFATRQHESEVSDLGFLKRFRTDDGLPADDRLELSGRQHDFSR